MPNPRDNFKKLTPGEIAELDQDIEATLDRMVEDIRSMRGDDSDD